MESWFTDLFLEERFPLFSFTPWLPVSVNPLALGHISLTFAFSWLKLCRFKESIRAYLSFLQILFLFFGFLLFMEWYLNLPWLFLEIFYYLPLLLASWGFLHFGKFSLLLGWIHKTAFFFLLVKVITLIVVFLVLFFLPVFFLKLPELERSFLFYPTAIKIFPFVFYLDKFLPIFYFLGNLILIVLSLKNARTRFNNSVERFLVQ